MARLTSDELQASSRRMKDLYWKEKDLVAAVQVAQEGIALGEAAALDSPTDAHELLGGVKRLYFDLASFTWPGWAEPGIDPTLEQQALGLAAAKDNLRFAVELGRDEVPLLRAHWMLAAHLLTSGDLIEARAEFNLAESRAKAAGANGEELLCRGFGLLSEVAMGRHEAQRDLFELVAGLAVNSDTAGYADQIKNCAKVLGLPSD